MKEEKMSKKVKTNLIKSLKSAVVEKDVESSYRAEFEKLFPHMKLERGEKKVVKFSLTFD